MPNPDRPKQQLFLSPDSYRRSAFIAPTWGIAPSTTHSSPTLNRDVVNGFPPRLNPTPYLKEHDYARKYLYFEEPPQPAAQLLQYANSQCRCHTCGKTPFLDPHQRILQKVNRSFAQKVIGAGVVGLAVARELASREGTSTILLERHDAPGTETSSRNSEVSSRTPASGRASSY